MGGATGYGNPGGGGFEGQVMDSKVVEAVVLVPQVGDGGNGVPFLILWMM